MYSFNNCIDITSDLNNYKDKIHYAEWINSLILKYMSNETCLLTELNYEEYLDIESKLYWNFDYEDCFERQEDYENDYYAAALLYEEINDIKPYFLDKEFLMSSEIKNAEIIDNQYDGNIGILCKGSLISASDSDISIADYIITNNDFNGVRLSINDIDKYKYLVVYGRKLSGYGQAGIYIYDESGAVIEQVNIDCSELDEGWHQYLIDIAVIDGNVDIIFHSGYTETVDNMEFEFVFSNIGLY